MLYEILNITSETPSRCHEQGEKEAVPVAVLFSGGLDSMILAALLDQCIDPKCKHFSAMFSEINFRYSD